MAKRITIYLPDDAETVIEKLQKKTGKSASWLMSHAIIFAEAKVQKQSDKHDALALKGIAHGLKGMRYLEQAKKLRGRKG